MVHAKTGPRAPNPPPARRHVVAGAIILIVNLAAYANAFAGGFVLDAKPLILDDPRVHELSTDNLRLIADHSYWWPRGESGLYRPVTTLSYLMNYAVLENAYRPAGYHAVNLGLHVLDALLVYALALRLLGSDGAAILAALLWAVHPLGTEAVANIVGRADLLAAAAVLGGLLMYVRSTETSGWRANAWRVGLFAAAVAGVFSKESAAILPAAIVLWEIAGHGERAVRRGSLGSSAARPAIRRRIAPFIAGVAIAGAALIAMAFQRSAVFAGAPPAEFPFADNPITGAGFAQGRATALAVIARYLFLFVWPASLSADYSYNAVPLATGTAADWLAWIVVAVALAATAFAYRRSRPVFFAAAFAWLTILPASNLFFPAGTIMAERLMYLPSAGLAICAVAGVFALARQLRRGRAAYLTAAGTLGVLIVACAARTIVRNRDWRDDLALWTAAARAQSNDYKAHKGVAGALAAADPSHANIDAVIAEADRAVAILDAVPDARNDPLAWRDAAGYYLAKSDVAQARTGANAEAPASEAVQAAARAVPLARRYVAIAEAGGIAAGAGSSHAVAANAAAMQADGERLLALAYLRAGDAARSLDAAVRAQTLDPLNPSVYRQRAGALLALDRPGDAATALAAGAIVTADAGLREALVGLFKQGLDEDGCALAAGTADTLNPSCPAVRRVVCPAIAEAIGIHVRSGRSDLADAVRATAPQFGCGASH